MLEMESFPDLREFEGDYEEYLFELGELKHEPINPPRADHVGENVYSFEWLTLNETIRRPNDPPNVLLGSILYHMERRITQRHASVAASFITWLGTNCGHSIHDRAQQLLKAGLHRDEAYECAWAIENKRRSGINHGIRYIESVLAGPDDFGKDIFSGMWGLRRMPNITIEDYETVEQLVEWLSTDRAQEFIRRCEFLINIRNSVSKPMDTIKVMCGVKI